MTYSLYRTRDHAGDSGSLSMIFRLNPETQDIEMLHNERPCVGWGIQVGSATARTYSAQDYWTTTPCTEILEERHDYVRFRTGNSEYEWKEF